MDVIELLKTDGASKGLCEIWQKKLKSETSIKRLSEMFIRGIDFCISENYPTLEFMRDNFKGKCEPYGIFIDDDGVSLLNKENVVLNGGCKANLMFDGYSVSRVFVRHDSTVKIHAQDHSMVTVDAFDNSYIKIASNDRASVLVFIHGEAKVDYSGTGVKVIQKNKNTY